MLHPSSGFTLKLKAAWTSDTLVSFHTTVRYENPEDLNLNLHLKSRIRPLTSTKWKRGNVGK